MSKVRLVTRDYGSLPGGGDLVEVGEIRDTKQVIAVIRTDFDKEPDGSRRVSADVCPVVFYERINNLVGKVLTIIDCAQANQATKDLVMQACWEWYGELTERLPDHKAN